MKKHTRIRDLMTGALLSALILSMAVPAFAALEAKTAEIYTGIKVYVNDQLVTPKDANGNAVDCVVIDGTTYLPIRAIGNALGLPVQYDGKTQSAYLGTHRDGAPIYLDTFDYFSGSASLETAATEQDNLNQGHSRCITGNFDRTYKLNGQYTALTGNLYQSYDQRSGTIYGNKRGALYIYTDGELAAMKEFTENTTGYMPEPINVDLTGVLELRIVFREGGGYYSDGSRGPLSLGEMALYT